MLPVTICFSWVGLQVDMVCSYPNALSVIWNEPCSRVFIRCCMPVACSQRENRVNALLSCSTTTTTDKYMVRLLVHIAYRTSSTSNNSNQPAPVHSASNQTQSTPKHVRSAPALLSDQDTWLSVTATSSASTGVPIVVGTPAAKNVPIYRRGTAQLLVGPRSQIRVWAKVQV